MKLNAAGVLAATVLGVLVVGGLIWGGQAIWGGDRLRPLEAATEPATPVATEERTETPAPDDYDAAWERFLEVIYRCDAMPDLGDDLNLYPQDGVALQANIAEFTTDQTWLTWCAEHVVLKRLAEFGPRNLNCTGTTCEAAVSVTSTGGLAFFEPWCTQNPEQCAELTTEQYTQLQTQRVMIYRPPNYQDNTPQRLFLGVLTYQEGQWTVTQIGFEVLPELTATP